MSSKMLLGHQVTRRAMGVTATITVHAANPFALIEQGFSMLNRLENLWSRFLPHSDITRLNNAHGETVDIDPLTVELIAHMKAAHSATDGRYNPTLLPIHRDQGDLESLVSKDKTRLPDGAQVWNTLDGIMFHSPTTLSLPATMTLDAGGIGKGFAADLIVDDLVQRGAVSVAVNIGGDARVASQSGIVESWNFDIFDSFSPEPVATISLLNGAIATSALDARYRGGMGPKSHIFSADSTPASLHTCSVIAPFARWAEIWTKYVLLSPTPIDDIITANLTALTVDNNGAVLTSPEWKEFQL